MVRNASTPHRRSRIDSFAKQLGRRPMLIVGILLLAFGSLWLVARSSPVKSKDAITVQAAGRGKGLLNPQDGRDLKVEYAGDSETTEALRSGSAQPLVLATGDFDGDGAPDLVTGYNYFGSGILTLQRGNIDAFVPKDLKIYDRAAQGQLPSSFLRTAQTTQLPEAPDFLLVGDFNGDGHKDVLTAARGGGLYLIVGDGRGGFEAPERLELPGQVTALTAGAFGHAEGWLAVIAAVVGPQGPALAVFNQDTSGLSRTPTICSLPAEATTLVLGPLDDDPYFDLGVAAGQEIIIVHGQKPAAPVSDGEPIDLQSRMEHIDLGFSLRGLAAGTFIPDGVPRMDLAALSSDGTIHLLQRSELNPPPLVDVASQYAGVSPYQVRAELRTRFLEQVKASAKVPMWLPDGKQSWTEVRELDVSIAPPGPDAPAALLTTANISARRADDLLLLDAASRQVHVLIDGSSSLVTQAANTSAPALSRVPVSFDVESAPVAVLPMPQKISGERDLVVLSAGQISPAAVPLAVTATFTVTKIADTNDGACNADCSLREAALAANLTAGVNTINVPGNLGTYNLSINNPGTLASGTLALPDLEIGSAGSPTNANVTVVGISGTPIINQTIANNDVITTGFTNTGAVAIVTLSLQNLEIKGGTFTGIFTGADDGAGHIANTTITNCNVHNNSNADATFGQGGGHQNQCGTLSVQSSTYASNSATNSVRGQGGAIFYDIVNPSGQCSTGDFTVTNSTFTSNISSVQTGFPGGGAFIAIINSAGTAVPISGSTFTSNQENGGGDGGAIASSTNTRVINVTTSTFVTNQVSNAAGRGGAVDCNAGLLNVNFCRFIGNTATTATNGKALARVGGTFNGTSNWWGQNTGPAANDLFGAVTSSPNLQLRSVISGANVHNTNQIAPVNGNTAIFTADILGLSTGGSTAASNLTGLATFPIAVGTIYSNGSPSLGSINTTTGQYVNGVANTSTTFTANGSKGIATVNAIADSETAPTQLLIGFTPVFVNQTGSDATPFASAACGGGANVPCYATMGAAITNVALTDLALVPGVINIQAGGYTESPNFNQGSTVNVTATVSNAGSLTFTNGTINANANSISLTGDWTNNGSTFNQGTSTVTFNGSGAQNLNGSAASQTFNNLTVNKGSSSTLTVGGSTTTLNLNGTLTLTAGTLAAGTASAINVGGNWTNNVGAGGFTPGSGTVTFNSTAAGQTINGSAASQTFNNLTVSKTAQILNTGGSTTQLDLNGNFSLSAGTFTAPATVNVAGDWTQTSGTTFTPGSGTVTFNSTGTPALNGTANPQTFNNLVINKIGGGSATGGGSLATLNLNGAMTLTAGTFSANTITAINLAGDWTNNGGTFAPNTSNVTFNNTTAAQSINGSAASQQFFALTMNKTGQTLNTGGSTATLDINSNLVLTAGTFTAPATMTIAGNFTQATGTTFTPGAGTVTFDGNGAQSIDGTLATKTFFGFGVNKSGGTLSVAASTTTLDINGNVTLTLGTFAAGTATSITVAGNWTNNGGTFTPGVGTETVTFDGGAGQTIGGTTATTFNRLTNSDAGGISMTNDNTVNGILALTSSDITVAATKTLTQPVGGSSTGTFDVNGRVQRTGFVTGGAALSFGNPFNSIQVTAGTAPANIVVDLARSVPGGAIGYSNAVQRTYTITPSTSAFTGTLRLHYLPTELNSNTANALNLWRFDATLPQPGWRGNPATSRDCAGGCTTNTSAFWVEKTGVTAFSPWTLNSTNTPTAANGTVSGRIAVTDGALVAGATINLSGSQSRETITDAEGNYSFDSVETNGFYTVTPSRANYTFSPANRSFSLLGVHTEASFTATANGDHLNAIDTTEFFVRQQYLDFLGREPDPPGFIGWVNTIRNCGAGDRSCDRVHVSESFFRSEEFQQRGYFVYRFYSTAFGQKPDYAAFAPDLGRVSGFLDATQLEAAKTAFANDFTTRPAFINQYGTMTNAQYVDALAQTAGVTLSNRQALVNSLEAGTLTRAAALRQIAESGEVYARYYNQAFVVMEYFGYLRRDPDILYLNWIDVLDANPADSRHMVEGFVDATEYRNRFAQ